MDNFDFNRITFTNQNYNFTLFYDRMKNVMLSLFSDPNLFNCNKTISSFIFEYFYGITQEKYKLDIEEKQNQLNIDLYNDKELKTLIKYDKNNIDISLKYTKKYYSYFIRIISLFGLFLDGLNESLMPNTTKSRKKIRYSNNHHFFISYSNIKQEISLNLTNFHIKQFKKPLNSIIIFYYGYKSFVTEETRTKIEKIFNLLIIYVSDPYFLRLISKSELTNNELIYLNDVKLNLYKILLKLYSRLNYEHSIYDLNPKIEKKVFIDKTLI